MASDDHRMAVDLHPAQGWLRSADWLKIEIGLAAAFHLLFGITIALAPAKQVVTTGLRPVFTVAPELLSINGARLAWAALFISAAAVLGWLMRSQTVIAQLVAWMVVIPLGVIWLGVFVLAVISGVGSAPGVVVWLFLLTWWSTVAVRVGLNTAGA